MSRLNSAKSWSIRSRFCCRLVSSRQRTASGIASSMPNSLTCTAKYNASPLASSHLRVSLQARREKAARRARSSEASSLPKVAIIASANLRSIPFTLPRGITGYIQAVRQDCRREADAGYRGPCSKSLGRSEFLSIPAFPKAQCRYRSPISTAHRYRLALCLRPATVPAATCGRQMEPRYFGHPFRGKRCSNARKTSLPVATCSAVGVNGFLAFESGMKTLCLALFIIHVSILPGVPALQPAIQPRRINAADGKILFIRRCA